MPRPAQTEEERSAARRRILAAAREVYAEAGLDGVTIRAVAARADCSAGAIYRYFRGRVDLVRAMWGDALDDLRQRIAAAAQAPGGHVERLRAMLRAYARFAREQPVAFGSTFLQLWQPTPERLVVPDPLAEPAYRLVRDTVAAACEDGQLAPVDPDLAAQILWGTVHGAVSLSRNLGDFPFKPEEERADAAIDHILKGLATQPIAPAPS